MLMPNFHSTDAASQETDPYSGDSQWTPPDHVLAGASKSEGG